MSSKQNDKPHCAAKDGRYETANQDSPSHPCLFDHAIDLCGAFQDDVVGAGAFGVEVAPDDAG